MARRLPRMDEAQEGLGQPTIMDAGLAGHFGVLYVHLAVNAIDLDRIAQYYELRAERDGSESTWPFGGEIFMLCKYIEYHVREQTELLERATLHVFDKLESEHDALGAALPYAVWCCVERGTVSSELEALFTHWKGKPAGLMEDVTAFFEEDENALKSLALRCLSTNLAPPVAPPTLAWWNHLVST